MDDYISTRPAIGNGSVDSVHEIGNLKGTITHLFNTLDTNSEYDAGVTAAFVSAR